MKIKNIYIHFPFCKRKCSFCDFSVHAVGNDYKNKEYFEDTLSETYVTNLIKEINFMGQNYFTKFQEKSTPCMQKSLHINRIDANFAKTEKAVEKALKKLAARRRFRSTKHRKQLASLSEL